MKKLLLCLGVCVTLLWSSGAGADITKCEEDPRECFDGFEEDDSIKPKDPKVKKTFDFPPIKAGFVIDFKHRDILPHISVEMLEFNVPYAGDFSVDLGVAVSRVFASLTWELVPLVKAGPCIWAGYNVREEDSAFGVGISILDF